MSNLHNSTFSIANLKRLSELKGKIKEFFTDEQIMELAQDFQLPHYVLTNPITKETTTYFISTEVNEWVAKNCITQNACRVDQTIEVTIFDYEAFRVSHDDVVPTELSLINELHKLPITISSTPPGIYFLCLGSEIVYVGQSTNIVSRIRDHRKDKQFSAIYFLPCYLHNLNALERKFIALFKPKYNILLMPSGEEFQKN